MVGVFGHGFTKALVTLVSSDLPSHSAWVNASSIFSKGKLWDITFVRGYLSLVSTKKFKATGRVYGS